MRCTLPLCLALSCLKCVVRTLLWLALCALFARVTHVAVGGGTVVPFSCEVYAVSVGNAVGVVCACEARCCWAWHYCVLCVRSAHDCRCLCAVVFWCAVRTVVVIDAIGVVGSRDARCCCDWPLLCLVRALRARVLSLMPGALLCVQ